APAHYSRPPPRPHSLPTRRSSDLAAAAEGLAAQADAPHHLALVPDADLAQLDPHMEGAGQVFDQLAEVHPAVGGKIKRHLGVVRSEEHTSELQSRFDLVCRLLLEK